MRTNHLVVTLFVCGAIAVAAVLAPYGTQAGPKPTAIQPTTTIGGPATIRPVASGVVDEQSHGYGGFAPVYSPSPAAPTAVAPQPVPASLPTPTGSWIRELGQHRIELEVTGNTLSGIVHVPADEGFGLDVEFLIEYAVTRDGLLYGVIQSLDVDVPNLPAEELDGLLSMKFVATQLVDLPISARWRVDGDVLTIKSFHMGIPGGPMAAELGFDTEGLVQIYAIVTGRYRATNARER